MHSWVIEGGVINIISINLLVVYRESVNLIGYITRRLSADSLQFWIANENRLFSTRDACFTLQSTSRAVFETFELPLNTIKHFFLNVTLHFYAMRLRVNLY